MRSYQLVFYAYFWLAGRMTYLGFLGFAVVERRDCAAPPPFYHGKTQRIHIERGVEKVVSLYMPPIDRGLSRRNIGKLRLHHRESTNFFFKMDQV